MIRFACPGCSATYTVGDDRAGKVTRCPKCRTKFLIPDPEPGEAEPPPAPAPAAAPPLPASSNEPVEIAPCPKCQTRLSVMPADLGLDVECPSCQTVFKAASPGSAVPALPPAPSKRSVLDDDIGPPTPRRRREDDDHRPRRRRRDDDEDEDRPSRRGRRDEEDDEYDRPRRRSRRRRPVAKSGAVTTVGVLNYILGTLCLGCSCVVFVASNFIKEALVGRARGGRPGPGPAGGIQQEDVGLISNLLTALGVGYIVFAVLLIVAGIGVTSRKTYGRVLTFITAAIALILCILSVVGGVVNLIGGNPGGLCGPLFAGLIWGGYGGYALMTMLKSGDEFS